MSKQTLNITPELYQYLLATGFREHPVLKQLREDMADHPRTTMQIAPEQGAFMQLLVQMNDVKRGIEIGTFTGYSALATALVMPDEGQLICCDTSVEWTDIAKGYWQQAGVLDRIDLRIAPALDTLEKLENQQGQFDWVFIDADKENYLNYYEACLPLLRSGGLMLIDNALWSGQVVNPQDEETAAIDRCNRFVFADQRVEMVLLPLADGLLLARKK